MEGVSAGDIVNLSVRPANIAIDEEVDEDTMVIVEGRIEARVYFGVMTQVTVSLGDVRTSSRRQAWHRSRADERWERGMTVKLGWQPEHCLVLR